MSKTLHAAAAALSAVAFVLYLAGMLTPFLKSESIGLKFYIWEKGICPSNRPIGHKECLKLEMGCDSAKSLVRASQAFFILSDIGSLAAIGGAVAALLGKAPAVAAVIATAVAFVFGAVTMGVTIPLWSTKLCGAPAAFSKVEGYKMGESLPLLITAFILSFLALVAAIVGFVQGGDAANAAGNAGATKAVAEEAPVRQEPPASTLVAVQPASQNPLDKEQPQPESKPTPAPEPAPAPVEEHPVQSAAAAEKRAQVLALDFEELKRKLPATKGDAAQKEQRFAMFDRIDAQGKGALTLEEVTAGLRDVLQVGDTVASLGQVIAKAFTKAAAAGQAAAGNAGGDGAATVEKNEFRLLLLYVRQYFRLFQIFATVDTTGDNRMALDEFRAAQPEFGAMGLTMGDADTVFHTIDADKSGCVDFHEFAMWALEQDGVLSG